MVPAPASLFGSSLSLLEIDHQQKAGGDQRGWMEEKGGNEEEEEEGILLDIGKRERRPTGWRRETEITKKTPKVCKFGGYTDKNKEREIVLSATEFISEIVGVCHLWIIFAV